MGRKYKNAPVYFTIGQVKHNPLLSLGAYLPAIQERMRKAGYPDFNKAMTYQLNLSAMPEGDGDALQPSSERMERFLFANLEGTKGFILQANALSFRTTEYSTFGEFLKELELGLRILDEAIGGLSYFEQIGLRYLDAVVPELPGTLGQFVAAPMMGLPSLLPERNFSHSFTEAGLSIDQFSRVVARTLIQYAPIGFPPDLPLEGLKLGAKFSAKGICEHAMLDVDGIFADRRAYDWDTVKELIGDLHEVIGMTFQTIVTDHARAAWDV